MADYVVPDDFPDIQSAIDALPPPPEMNDILVRQGLYDLIPDPAAIPAYPYTPLYVKPYLKWHGEGIDRTIIRMFPEKQPPNSTFRGDMIQASADLVDFTLEDLTIIQNGSPDNAGNGCVFYPRGVTQTNTAIRRVKITDVFCAALAVWNFQNALIEDCEIYDVWTGMALSRGSFGTLRRNTVKRTTGDAYGSGQHVEDMVIEHNHFEDIGDTAIDFASQSWVEGNTPHDRLVARYNTLINGGIRVTWSNDVSIHDNKIVNGIVGCDAGQGRPVRIEYRGNTIESNRETAIRYSGALDSSIIGNTIRMTPPEDPAVIQTAVRAGIWGTGIVEGNRIYDPKDNGIDFADYRLGGGANITIRNNDVFGFGDLGIWDNAKLQTVVSILENRIWSDKPTARWGIFTEYIDPTTGKSCPWNIERNALKVRELLADVAVNAPSSTLIDNYEYTPISPVDWLIPIIGGMSPVLIPATVIAYSELTKLWRG